MSLCEVGWAPEIELDVPLDPDETHTSFPATFLHVSVTLPDLTVAPAFVHLPPALFAALAEQTGNTANIAPTMTDMTPFRAKKVFMAER